MNKCLLCLNLTFSKNALDLSEIQECGSTINEIIKFHFWFHNVSKFYFIIDFNYFEFLNF